jgi:hypothetical protein
MNVRRSMLAALLAVASFVAFQTSGFASASTTNLSLSSMKPANDYPQPPVCEDHDQKEYHWPDWYFWTYDHTDYQYPYETIWFKFHINNPLPDGPYVECGRTIPGAKKLELWRYGERHACGRHYGATFLADIELETPFAGRIFRWPWRRPYAAADTGSQFWGNTRGVIMFARVSAGSTVRVALLQGATCNLTGPVTFVTRRKQATTASVQVVTSK